MMLGWGEGGGGEATSWLRGTGVALQWRSPLWQPQAGAAMSCCCLHFLSCAPETVGAERIFKDERECQEQCRNRGACTHRAS